MFSKGKNRPCYCIQCDLGSREPVNVKQRLIKKLATRNILVIQQFRGIDYLLMILSGSKKLAFRSV